MIGDQDDDHPDTAPPPLDPAQIVDAGSEEGQRRAQREVKRRVRKEAEFIKRLLADPAGQRFIWDLLTDNGLFSTPFACGPNGFPQPEATWFNAGKQAAVTGLYHRLMAADLEGVHAMLAEFDGRFRKVAR